MLVWFCLLFATTWSFLQLYNTLFQGLVGVGLYNQVALVPILPFFLGTNLWIDGLPMFIGEISKSLN